MLTQILNINTMKLCVIVSFFLVMTSPLLGKTIPESKANDELLYRLSYIASINAKISATTTQSAALNGNTLNFLKGLKFIVLLSYIGLVALIVTLSQKRRRMVERFESLKQKHVSLSGELEEKIAICSNLSAQANQKARELTSSTLSVIQKQNVLASVKSELKVLAPMFNEGPLSDSVFANKLKSLNEEGTADDRNYWDDFMINFRMLYPNYLSNIKASGNDITEKELKLAALLRLGLDTKKIAGLLNLSPVSIKVFRHRLRKKLELPEDVNLYNYLSHFDNLEKVNP